MRRVASVLFFTLLVCVSSFADFVISPKVGYANIFLLEENRFSLPGNNTSTVWQKNSWNNLAVSLDMGFVGNSGFTFFFNNNVSFLGSIRKTNYTDIDFDIKFQELKGAYWNGELLLGYTFRKPKVDISLTGGVGVGGVWDMMVKKIGIKEKEIDTKELLKISGFNLGLSLNFSTAFYFTDNIGLGFSLTDTAGYGFFFSHIDKEKLGIFGGLINDEILSSGAGGVSNVFCLKAGPVFKF